MKPLHDVIILQNIVVIMTSEVLCMQNLASEPMQIFDYFSMHAIFIYPLKVLPFTEKMVLYMMVQDFINLTGKLTEFQVLRAL
jgi:hypothetical protein